MKNEVLIGDCRAVLPTLEADSVQCVVTSPPYWGLRDYGNEPLIWDGIKDCQHQWGLNIKSKGISGGVNNSQQSKYFMKSGASYVPENNSQFCLKCNAWRGSLGLEPTPELYAKHIVSIFIEVIDASMVCLRYHSLNSTQR